MISSARILVSVITLGLLAGCAVGPNYKKPTTAMTAQFKEAKLQTSLPWKKAEPKDDAARGTWWTVFGDAELDALEAQVAISNENVKASEAAFRQARALVAEARSSFFPIVGATVSQTRSGNGGGSSTSGTPHSAGTFTNYDAQLDASWEIDLWGKLRRQLESNEATAQATAADLAGATLSAQAELAIDYLDLRLADKQKRILEQTVADYEKALQLTKNQYATGVAARSDVIQAQVQLESAQAQLIDVGVQRAQFEHAIAILIGKAPAEFTLDPSQFVPLLPVIPAGVPSELLERRPDIAGAERRVAAANAQIGVAEAAFFPDLTLAASGGYSSSSFAQWFTLPNRMWSIGPTLVETLFDAGLRSAQTEAAIASYDQTVATYRQTVLGGFQEVEDNLAAVRILEQEHAMEQKAVEDSHTSVTIAINQYKAGIVNYLSVITTQTTELNNEISLLNIERSQLGDSATLIKALGGGWNQDELGKPYVTQPQTTPLSIIPPLDLIMPGASK